jgi:protein SCO1/2
MEEDRKIKITTKVIILLSIIIALISSYILLFVELPNKPLAGQGGSITEDVPIGGKFELTDQNGNKFSSDQMRGHLSLIYFGFTYCPDICPTTLNKLSSVISTLEKYKIDIMPIFITIDPQRDTSSLLKEYLGHFHPKFIGLTGSDDDLKRVADLYKVFYTRSEASENSGQNYMIDHSSFVYLMDKSGKYMKHFYMNTPEEEIVEYIRVNK